MFLHHEHGRCRLRPTFDADGNVHLYCVTHEETEEAIVTAVQLCGEGRLILNVLPSVSCGLQVIKFDLRGETVRTVSPLPAVLRSTRPILIEKHSAGYLPLGCSCCRTDLPTLYPLALELCSDKLRLLMHCGLCYAESILSFETLGSLIVGTCHNGAAWHLRLGVHDAPDERLHTFGRVSQARQTKH